MIKAQHEYLIRVVIQGMKNCHSGNWSLHDTLKPHRKSHGAHKPGYSDLGSYR